LFHFTKRTFDEVVQKSKMSVTPVEDVNREINVEWEFLCNPGFRFYTGVKEDLEQFIYSVFYIFDERHDPRFTIFSKAWKESNLGLILNGRESFRETHELTEYVFYQLKQYTKSKLDNKQNNILIRYAAIYCLYAFFFKQPCRPKARIKLSYGEFVDLEGLVEEARRDNHYDVLYAWYKLICCHAFQYSVVDKHYGVEVAKKMDKKDNGETLMTYSASSYLKSKDFRSVLRRLNRAHSRYSKMKTSFLKTSTDDMISLNCTSETIIEDIEQIANQESKPEPGAEIRSGVTLKGASSIGEKRKKLKERFLFGETDCHNVGSKVAFSQEVTSGKKPPVTKKTKKTRRKIGQKKDNPKKPDKPQKPKRTKK